MYEPFHLVTSYIKSVCLQPKEVTYPIFHRKVKLLFFLLNTDLCLYFFFFQASQTTYSNTMRQESTTLEIYHMSNYFISKLFYLKLLYLKLFYLNIYFNVVEIQRSHYGVITRTVLLHAWDCSLQRFAVWCCVTAKVQRCSIFFFQTILWCFVAPVAIRTT